MKALRVVFAFVLLFGTSLSLAGCGVKGDLEKPNDQAMKKGEKDPSKPPSTLGR